MSAPSTPRAGLALPTLLAGLFLACGGASGNQTGDSRAQGGRDATGAPEAGLLDRMPDAPFTTCYRGIRRVLMEYTVLGQEHVLSYREEVASDGLGKFKVIPIEVTSAGLTTYEEELFLALWESREGFIYRYRDFRVRDPQRFLASHAVVLEGGDDVIAGVQCERLRAERLDHPRSYFRAWIDPRTGLVLRWEERTLEGVLLGEVEFESIDYQPDLGSLELRDSLFELEELDLASDLSGQVGFPVLEPQLLPSGYLLVSATRFTDPQGLAWLKRMYGDGGDQLALLQSGPQGSGPLGGKIDWLEVGAWVVLDGEVERSRVVAMGRVTLDELRLLVQSSGIGMCSPDPGFGIGLG